MVDNVSFDEFRTQLLKRNSKKDFRIKNSLGSKYIYRAVDKSNPLRQVSETDFLHIVRTVNNYLVQELINGQSVTIPFIGIFYIQKRELKTFIKDNKLITRRKIDWYSTHKLWYEDEQAKRDKILVRFPNTDTYELKWFKLHFKNMRYFKFKLHRTFEAKLREQLKDNKDIYIYGE